MEKEKGYYARLILWLATALLIGFLLGKKIVIVKANNTENTTNSVVEVSVTPTPTIEPLPTLTQDQKTIEDDIRSVFGKDTDKALTLLRGTSSKSCAENRGLDPTATNKNDDTLKTTDYGLFMINSHWQGVSNVKFLLDPAINIRMAYRIFVDSGYSFKMWSCGKALNI